MTDTYLGGRNLMDDEPQNKTSSEAEPKEPDNLEGLVTSDVYALVPIDFLETVIES
jgi:hypothetical protein